MANIAPHTALRPTPYHAATVAEGVTSFTTCNQMLIPLDYGDPDAEYERLMNGVSQWDIGGQRQIQLEGRDAARLAQILCSRDLSKCVADQGKYVPLCNHEGTLIDALVVSKLADDLFWFSVTDRNVLLWMRCVVAGRRLDVGITEPDVSSMAVQGPKAEAVIASVFGDWVRDLKPLRFGAVEIDGIPVKVSRSGFLRRGGFEIHLLDGDKGAELWNVIREAGQPWGIGPGCPNHCERIESGRLSRSGDTDSRTNPFEVRLDEYVDLDVDDQVIGIRALRKIHAEGPKRHQLGLVLDGDAPAPDHSVWYEIVSKGKKVGDMTNGVWSRNLRRNIGFALISREFAADDTVQVRKDGHLVGGTLCELPFS